MKNMDYEMIFNYISLILAISIFVMYIYLVIEKILLKNLKQKK